jgi:DNA polymerase-3 subunit delta'
MPFRQLVGHRHLVALLARAVSRQSLPPSLLFAGPEGVGKFTTAVALATVMNCESPLGQAGPEPSGGRRQRPARPRSSDPVEPLVMDACGACPTCVRIQRAVIRLAQGADSVLDCLLVLGPDEKRSIKVDPTRAFIGRCGYRPLDGKRRLAVIDEADSLEVSAQNALLKVLEEPPTGTCFVLVSSRPDALLPTILSRCPRLRFGPLTTAELAGVLSRDHDIEPAAASRAAALADGSVGRALSLVSRGGPREARDVALATLAAVVRAGGPAARLGAARQLVAKGGGESGRKKGGDAVSRGVLADRLEAVGALLRDVQVVSSRADGRWMASSDLAADLTALAGDFDPQRVVRAFAAVERARAALERNASPKVVADWLVLQL